MVTELLAAPCECWTGDVGCVETPVAGWLGVAGCDVRGGAGTL